MGLTLVTRNDEAWPPAAALPQVPTNVTSVTKDGGAVVSWYAPTDAAVTSYVVTPYVAGVAQTPTTVAVGSVTTLADSYGGTARQATVTGLTNGTAHTFTVKARSASGDSAESTASGENTPLSGLVFGDDFNGPAGSAPDPEWWVYDRCGYLAQNEVQWYKPSHCVLDGAGSLKVTAEHTPVTGTTYASDGNRTITQPWTSGACQSNARTYEPTTGNTMVFEAKFQVNPHAGSGYWPGFFWLEGHTYLDAWKTDPLQQGWDSTGKAEIDVAEWFQSGSPDTYGNVSWAGTNEQHNVTGTGLSTSQHTYRAEWKPGVTVRFYRDDALTYTSTSQIPDAGAQFFLMIYMQMLGGGLTNTESAYVDYVRVYDKNLG